MTSKAQVRANKHLNHSTCSVYNIRLLSCSEGTNEGLDILSSYHKDLAMLIRYQLCVDMHSCYQKGVTMLILMNWYLPNPNLALHCIALLILHTLSLILYPQVFLCFFSDICFPQQNLSPFYLPQTSPNQPHANFANFTNFVNHTNFAIEHILTISPML